MNSPAADDVTRIEVAAFARAVEVPEAAPFLIHLGYGDSTEQSSSRLRAIPSVSDQSRALRPSASIALMSELSTRSTALYEKVTQLREHL